MSDRDDELTVAQRLGRLLDRGLLPAGGPAEAAERLIERLERPARVALLGLPGSGKSAILNLLAGTVVVPETLRLPTIIVQHGPEPRMLCTLADGRNEIVPGDNLENSLSLSPALITLELDLPALKVISLLEIAAGPQEVDQRRAALWAGKRADILIWCTTSYLPKEQLVWEGMPDAFKDNGFLLLTKVDLLGGREAASGMHHRVEQRAGGEFRQVLSISAKEARAATIAGGQVDRERFRESGAGLVISTIKNRVQSARRADTDTAELILARQAGQSEEPQRRTVNVAVPAAPTAGAPVAKSPVTLVRPQSVEIVPQEIAGMSVPVVLPAMEPPAPTVVEPEVAADIPAAAEPEETAVAEAVSAALNDAVADPQPEVPADPAVPVEPIVKIEIALEPEPVATPEPNLELPEEPQPIAEALPEPVAVSAPDDEKPSPSFDPAPPESPEPSVGFLTSAGGQRLSDRIKQIRPAAAAPEAPPVPLRATWKSRNDTATPSAPEAPAEPVKTPRPRPMDPSTVGRSSFRVSPAKDATPRTGSFPQLESEPSASAEDPLKALRNTDDLPTLIDSQADLPAEAVEESSDLAAPTPEPDVVFDVPNVEAEDPAMARLSALRPPRPQEQPQSQAEEPEPEEEPAGEELVESIVEDPALARLSALRQPRSETPALVRHVKSVPDSEGFAPASSDMADMGRLSGIGNARPAEPERTKPPEPVLPTLVAEDVMEAAVVERVFVEAPQIAIPAPASAQIETEPPVAELTPVADASVRRSLSERISSAAAQVQEGSKAVSPLPTLGPRMPRSGEPRSPRVTVLRERRVEVQPASIKEQPRISAEPLPVSQPAAPESGAISVTEAGLLDLAIGTIVSRSTELLALIDPKEKLPVDFILEHGRETTEKVIYIVSKGNSGEMRRINGSVSELQDVIMLMQLEKGHAPADDTLTLLLQLRRELETLRPI